MRLATKLALLFVLALFVALSGCPYHLGKPSFSVGPSCGNLECEAGEDTATCPQDCGICTDSDGVDYYTTGTTTDGTGASISDSCTAGVFTEGLCYHNLAYGFQRKCPAGCNANGTACAGTGSAVTSYCFSPNPSTPRNPGTNYFLQVGEKVCNPDATKEEVWTCATSAGSEPQFKLLESCAGGFKDCANGACVAGSNVKDFSKYSPKEAFIVSDNDWKTVLELVPATIWRNQNTGQKFKYPLLIYHSEEAGFDADAVIEFLQQYSPSSVTLVGSYPAQLYNLLSASQPLGAGLDANKIQSVSRDNIPHYWSTFNTVVYVDNNYSDVLLASTYASHKNAPLVIQGSQLDANTYLHDRTALCIGPLGWNPEAYVMCSERYTLAQLQEHYVSLTGTDKVIMVNPNDINPKFTLITVPSNEILTPEKSSASLSELYTKTSLAAPYLAAARDEVIIPVAALEPDTEEIAYTLHSRINSLMPDLLSRSGGITSAARHNHYIYMYDIDNRSRKIIGGSGTLNLDPHIDGSKVVWRRLVHGLSPTIGDKIMLYNDNTSRVSMLTNDALVGSAQYGQDRPPKILGENVVWAGGSRSGNFDIYLHNITSGVTQQITTNAAVQDFPAVSNSIIVWEDYRNGNADIYMYNLSTSTETRITTNTADQRYPAIYGDKIVWQDYRNGSTNPDIYMYNLSTSTETRITTNTAGQYHPAIYGDKIVWDDYRNGYADIYMYNLSTSTETRITTNTADQWYPAIYGDKIVWQDNRNGNVDIYMCDLSKNGSIGGCLASDMKTQITSEVSDQIRPSVSGDKIVWYDQTPSNLISYVNPSVSGDKIAWYAQQPSKFTSYLNGYLTIVASAKAIPIHDFYGDLEGESAADQVMYADLDGSDGWPDMFSGRISGITLSDASAYVARDIFYSTMLRTTNMMLMQSSQELGDIYNSARWATQFKASGYNAASNVHPESAYSFSPSSWLNKSLVSYSDHGDSHWAGIDALDIPQLQNSVVFAHACLTCQTQGITSTSFCMRAIRKGALGYFGAVRIASVSDFYMEVMNGIYAEGLNTGQAFTKYYRADYSNGYFTYIGDPVWTPYRPYPLSDGLTWST